MDHELKTQAAKQAGCDDAMYDGLYLATALECQCDKCRKAYDDGQESAMQELFAGKQIAPTVAEPVKTKSVSVPVCPIHHTEMIVCEISMDGKVLGYMYACTDKDCGEAEDCDTPDGYPKIGELSRYAMEKDAE